MKATSVFAGLFLMLSMLGAHAQTAADGTKLATEGKFQDALSMWEEVGDAPSLRNIGGLYVSGVLGQQDLNTARSYFERAADMGDAQAMLSLGYLYANGMSVAKDPVVAEDWFRQAADQSLPEAQFMLARMILDRNADQSEITTALKAMNDAAVAMHPGAMAAVGDLLRTGTYTERDVEKAIGYYKAAGEAGLVEAWTTLGDIYLFAELGAPDIPVAIANYRKGAEMGSAKSMYALAYLFYHDPGADEKLLKTAYDFARTAAFAWDEQAQLLLGQMYMDDRAVPRDDAQAYFWLDLAASAGVIEAHHIRALAYATLGAENAAQIHADARKWFEENHSVPHTHRLIEGNTHNFR